LHSKQLLQSFHIERKMFSELFLSLTVIYKKVKMGREGKMEGLSGCEFREEVRDGQDKEFVYNR